MPNLQHRIKAIDLQPSTEILEREHKHEFPLRLLLLLLLMFYAATSFLKLASSSPPPPPPPPYLVQPSDHPIVAETTNNLAPKIATPEGLLRCDRSQYRTDVCYMKGDIRTDSSSSSILVYGDNLQGRTPETIRPYTRKWETSIMNTIYEISLIPAATHSNASQQAACGVVHDGVPAVVFSTGGYTGNVYHEFNDGLIPLYITARRFRGEVVLVVLEYHSWWVAKYRKVIEQLTNYKLVDFSKDRRVHCFKEMIVGLEIHGDLTIDSQLMTNCEGMHDFQALLSRAFGATDSKPQPSQPPPPAPLPLSSGHCGDTHRVPTNSSAVSRPRMTIFIRNQSRVLLNLREIVKACHRTGFDVRILNPRRGTPLSDIHRALAASDAMLAVHGAAVTHLLFMRPGAVLIQIVPLGLDWPANAYYGEPARRLGLEYVAYKVAPEESSLYKEYDRRDPVIVDPSVITSKGWWETKKVYLDKQNVRVNIRRFSRVLGRAYSHVLRLHATV